MYYGASDVRDGSLPAVILAGGEASPEFQQKSGVKKRCLVRHDERTLLETAVDALRTSGVVDSIVVVGDVPPPEGVQVRPEGTGFVENLFRGLEACRAADMALVSTSDMPFIDGEVVKGFVEGARELDADLVYPIVPVELCRQAYPRLRRTSLALREGTFTGGNMVLLRPDVFLQRRRHIEAAYALRKSPFRIAMMLGPWVALSVGLGVALRVGVASLPQLERAVSRMLHAEARALILEAPAIATDVDRVEDLEVLQSLN